MQKFTADFLKQIVIDIGVLLLVNHLQLFTSAVNLFLLTHSLPAI